jgi:penicillin G amidase
MRIIPFVTGLVLTGALIFALDKRWGSAPAMGRFLSPQQGFWQNAEPANGSLNEQLTVKGLKGEVQVYLDERLVPHVFAQHDEDAYYVQGYLHAKYRLWQMEFQTIAAAGRVSEKMGADPRFLRYDREQRRMGMVWAAENALKEMEGDAQTKAAYNAYTAGVNAYIATVTAANMPIEYKLLGYRPEPWSNLKSALFLKMMSKTLAGWDRDLELTNERTVFSDSLIRQLYPQVADSLVPIVPKGTAFAPPAVVPIKPANADSLYFGKDSTIITAGAVSMPDSTNGSNNWVVAGSKTASGAPILCNDPHLELSLPSIWYEMQLHTPTMNVYGATFPGTPSVIIGFNENVAWGVTNAQRDVKDYYYVRFKDESKKEYWFNGGWQPAQLRIDTFKIKGGADAYDTVAYTVFGPVMYDQSFTNEQLNGRSLALTWTAHNPSNEALTFLKLNRATNYADYEDAIKTFTTPGQNFVFASRQGDIAIWQQGRFPARWAGQGVYVMPGEDSSYLWQGYIPQPENPHAVNPVSGFLQSANQRPADSTYPYFIPGQYINPRGVAIDRRLSAMQNITPQDMQALQQDYYSEFAADVVPLLLQYVNTEGLSRSQQNYISALRKWNFVTDANAMAPTIYQTWWDSLEVCIWADELAQVKGRTSWPDDQTLFEWLKKDSAMRFVDDVTTPERETLQQRVTKALQLASKALEEEEPNTGLVWYKHKNPAVQHILKENLAPFGRYSLQTGGWGNTINAITRSHGPSWRMVVQLSNPVEAYGIYPGGQSGNPGSRFYDNSVNDWAAGKYYRLWLMKEEEKGDKRVIGTLTFRGE